MEDHGSGEPSHDSELGGPATWAGPPAWELLFWFLVIIFHLAFMVYAAWRLAVKYTESTGTNVTIIEKAPPCDEKKDEGLPLLSEDATSAATGSSNGAKKRRPLHA